MTGINSGILTNGYPLTSEQIVEIEKRVLENRETFVFINDKNKLCFSTTVDPQSIVELAWEEVYKLSKDSTTITKDTYKRLSLDSFEQWVCATKAIADELWKITKLPNNYQQVSYIEGTGTQWIDTNFVANQDTRVVCDYQYTAENSAFIYGSRANATTDGFCFNWGSGSLLTSYNDSGNYHIKAGVDLTRHVSDKNKNLLYLDGVLKKEFTYENFSTPGTLELFAAYHGGTRGYLPSKARICDCQIFDNGTLIRHFIPCYRKSDSTIGMYDIINDRFYTNSGSGTFIKGSNV